MDQIVLYSPAGSALALGSYIDWQSGGPDFGEVGLMQPAFTVSPAREGGYKSHRLIGIRRFNIPLRVASSSTYTDSQFISLMRLYSSDGAYVDVQPEGTASTEAVRFDIADGRFELTYNPWLNRLDRQDGKLVLDVQPFGYWPTMILLASAASIGGPGVLTFSGGSIFGDAPGLAELFIAPTSATSYGPGQKTDSVYWSLGARASFQAWWVAASGLAVASNSSQPATLLGDAFAPGSQTVRYFVNSLVGPAVFWTNMVSWVVPPSLEPAYRGRFRAYSWLRLGPSTAAPYFASLDVQSGTTLSPALASAAPIATLPPWTPSAGGQTNTASPAYSLLDLGEVSLPPVASTSHEAQVRLWCYTPSFVACNSLDVGGLYLQPLDGAAGILPRGILQPTVNAPSALGRFFVSAVTQDQFIASPTSVIGSIGPMVPAAPFHRGVLPIVGASTLQLDLNMAGNRATLYVGTTQPPIRSEPHFAQVSVRYRPRFTFMKGF